MRRGRGRLLAAMASTVVAGSLLAACGSGGAGSLVHEACGDVTHSIALYQRAKTSGGPAGANLREEALIDLRKALGPAALAGSAGGQYQALQATLSESSRVSEGELIEALSAQCAAAASPGGAG